MTILAEYIWLDVDKKFRSKIKVITDYVCLDKIYNRTNLTPQTLAYFLPIWNYDGSSTGQTEGLNSELTIKPVAVYDDPFKEGILVMCATYDKDDNPLPSNYRDKANEIFKLKPDEKPWFGIEQEYFAFKKSDKRSLIDSGKVSHYACGTTGIVNPIVQGKYYCSVGMGKAFYREIAERHLQHCCFQ